MFPFDNGERLRAISDEIGSQAERARALTEPRLRRWPGPRRAR
jgi:hypothetical protein